MAGASYIVWGDGNPDWHHATAVRWREDDFVQIVVEDDRCLCGHAMHSGICGSQPGFPSNGCDCPQGEK